VDLDSDDLDAWTSELRVRVVCGELAGLPQVDLGNGTRAMPIWSRKSCSVSSTVWPTSRVKSKIAWTMS